MLLVDGRILNWLSKGGVPDFFDTIPIDRSIINLRPVAMRRLRTLSKSCHLKSIWRSDASREGKLNHSPVVCIQRPRFEILQHSGHRAVADVVRQKTFDTDRVPRGQHCALERF